MFFIWAREPQIQSRPAVSGASIPDRLHRADSRRLGEIIGSSSAGGMNSETGDGLNKEIIKPTPESVTFLSESLMDSLIIVKRSVSALSFNNSVIPADQSSLTLLKSFLESQRGDH